MRLEIASIKAIRYACMNFHYSKSVPINPFGFSVFENNDWCGVIVYSLGANKNIAKEFNLNSGQVIELTRVALNNKQSCTSKALALSLKLIKRKLPLCKLIVSYADKGQNHIGIIYQASNWLYLGDNESSGYEVFANGRWMHKRQFDGLSKKPKNIQKRIKPGKYKYIYPLDKSLIPMCKAMSKPYPKHAPVAQGSAPANQAGDGGRPDPGAQSDSHEKQQNPTA